jgi:metal-dependent amidase/aminoacylase/carboxypeptidase family protein
MLNDEPMMEVFGEEMKLLGRPANRVDPDFGMGSTDMGNVSHVVRSIHPYLAICEKKESAPHEHTFAKHAGSDRALGTGLVAAKALALTALRFVNESMK